MEGRDGSSPGGAGGLAFHLQPGPGAPAGSAGVGGTLLAPAPVRPPPPGISLASPGSDGASSPHNLVNMSIGTPGSFSAGIGSPNLARSTDPQKRKRGRPRKYPGTDGGGSGLGTSLSLTRAAPVKSPTSPGEKRGRGRPPGSGKKQLGAFGDRVSGAAGSGFVPHVITIAAGEDVANKIFQFCQQGPRAVCVLSANGSISNVTLRHDSSYGGNITYEGRYEILSLSGSFLPSDVNGARSRTGGLSVSIAASDGKVVGGSVSGLLVAATPVQIVVGSFAVAEAGGARPRLPTSPAGSVNADLTTSIGLSPPIATPPSAGPASPVAPRQAKTESLVGRTSGGGASSLQNVNHQGGNGTPSAQHGGVTQFGGWQSSQPDTSRRTPTDINVTIPDWMNSERGRSSAEGSQHSGSSATQVQSRTGGDAETREAPSSTQS